MAYFSHRGCWRVASSVARMPLLGWSRLAVQTRPFELRSSGRRRQFVVCHDQPGIPIFASLPPDDNLLHADTPLGEILSKARILPSELQFQVMGLLDGTMFASLLQAKILVLAVLPRLHPRSDWNIRPRTYPLGKNCNQSGEGLCCRLITIMGRSYLSRLALKRIDDSIFHIPLANRAVRGLQFALGRFGLWGIRISYEDRSYSSWLGESTSCWIGMIRCSDLSKLRVIADVSHSDVLTTKVTIFSFRRSRSIRRNRGC